MTMKKLLSDYLYNFEEKHVEFKAKETGIFNNVPDDMKKLLARNKIKNQPIASKCSNGNCK